MQRTIDALTGEITVDEAWVPPAPEPTFLSYEEAAAAMVSWIDDLSAKVEGQYPSAVRRGWDEEENMAAAYLAGTETAQQLSVLEADAAAKDRTPADHAQRILNNGQTYREIMLKIRNLWLSTDHQLVAAEDPAQYEVILDGAKQQAIPMAQAYGLA